MHEFDKYKTQLSYPKKADYKTYNVYKDGEVVASNACIDTLAIKFKLDSDGIVRKLKNDGYLIETIVDDETFNRHMKDYTESENQLRMKFKMDLFEEFDVVNSPKKDLAYDIAWDRGHSSGFSSVWDEFSELVCLID